MTMADFSYWQDVQSRVSDVVLGKEKPVEESNPEFEKLKNYVFQLEDHLAEAQKHAYRLVKRHRGISNYQIFVISCVLCGNYGLFFVYPSPGFWTDVFLELIS